MEQIFIQFLVIVIYVINYTLIWMFKYNNFSYFNAVSSLFFDTFCKKRFFGQNDQLAHLCSNGARNPVIS